jgi:hypothetical protein
MIPLMVARLLKLVLSPVVGMLTSLRILNGRALHWWSPASVDAQSRVRGILLPGLAVDDSVLAVFKIFCDHIRPLKPVGEFLGH